MRTPTARPYAKALDFERATRSELLSTCLRNAANSFRTFAMEGETIAAKGTTKGQTETGPSWQGYMGNVLVLYVHIKTSSRTEAINKAYQKIAGFEADPNEKGIFSVPLADLIDLHHEILEMLEEKGELEESKIPRTLID